MRTIDFHTLLTAFANEARVVRSAFTADEQGLMCGDLNAAAHWLWTTATHSQALPEMLTGAAITLSDAGVIAAADIHHSDFWSVWQSDPRDRNAGCRATLQLAATARGNGDVKVLGGGAGDEVYVVYKTLIPQWSLEAASANCEYAVGGLAHCNGHVYRALVAGAHGGDLSDTTAWAEVLLPQSLQYIIVMRANYQRMRLGAKVPEAAGRERQALMEALEAAFIGSEDQPGDKLWLYNQNK